MSQDFLSYHLLGFREAWGTEESVLSYIHSWGHSWQSLTKPEK